MGIIINGKVVDIVRFNLRLGPRLHKILVARAKENNRKLHGEIIEILSNAVGFKAEEGETDESGS